MREKWGVRKKVGGGNDNHGGKELGEVTENWEVTRDKWRGKEDGGKGERLGKEYGRRYGDEVEGDILTWHANEMLD